MPISLPPRRFLLKHPYGYLAQGVVVQRNSNGDYYVTFNTSPELRLKGTPPAIEGGVVESRPDLFEELDPVIDVDGTKLFVWENLQSIPSEIPVVAFCFALTKDSAIAILLENPALLEEQREALAVELSTVEPTVHEHPFGEVLQRFGVTPSGS